MLKKRIAAILSVLIIIVQGAYGLGFNTQAHAAEITDNIITSVTMAVYDNGVPVTDVVYKQGAEVKLTYDWELPDNTYQEGDTYSFELPDHFVLASDIMGTPLQADGLTLGHFDVLKGNPNKVIMTFGQDVDKYFGVHGSFSINTKFDKASFTETTEQHIVFPVNGGNQTVTLEFVPDNASIIEKSGKPVGTNKDGLNAKQITWTVDVNKVLSSVYDASVTDVIPAGLALTDPLDVKVYELNVKLDGSAVQGAEIPPSQYTVTDPSGNLNVAFKQSPITGAYRIQFTTDITDLTKKSFTNEASLKGTGLPASKSSATVNVSYGTPLKKTSSAYDPNTQMTTWEIDYNYNELPVAQANAVLKDYFDNTQELVADSLQVFPVNFLTNAGGTVGDTPVSNYTLISPSTVPSGKNGFELKFNSDINSAYKIKYKTKATGRVEKDTTITNTVYSGDTYETGTRSIRQVIIAKTLPSSGIDYANKKVKWSVTINADSYQMDNVVVKDVFPNKGLKIIPGSIVVKKGDTLITTGFSIQNEIPDTGFEVKFNSQITGPYTITYETYFDNQWLASDWLTTDAKFVNRATVEWTKPGSADVNTKTVTASFDPKPAEKANGYKSGSYNASSKEIIWSVGVNYNRNPLNSAEVTDTIEGKQVYVPGSVEIYNMIVAKNGDYSQGTAKLTLNTDYTVSYNETTKLLKVKFTKKIESGYIINFKTSLKGKLVDSPAITNTANLYNEGKEESKDLTASLTIPKANEFVQKSGSQSNTKIKWTVSINYSQSYIEDAVVTDDPSDNQILLADSFKLYATTANPAGDVAKTGTPLVDGKDYELIITTDLDSGKQQFVLKFKAPIEKAYILEYESLIVANNNDKVTNKVGLTGKNSTTITKTSTKDITVALSSADGVGTGTRKALKIIKADGADQSKLSGATFALYRKSGSSEVLFNTLTTDANGEAVFKNLWPGKYLLQEISAPSGYVLDSGKKAVTFDSTTSIVEEFKVYNQKAATPTPTSTPTASPTASPVVSPTPTPPVKPTETPTPTAPPPPPPAIDYSTPTPVTSSVPGTVVTPGPSATPAATPSASPVQTPAVPQPTAVTTDEEVPIDGEIPLGGVPSIGEQPAHGTVKITPDGKWTYTPDPGYTGKDKFTIVVTDKDGNEEEEIIEVGVDEVPKGTVTDTPDTGENGLPGKLPQTGENSPLPLYLTGGGLIILGAVMSRRFKNHKKSK
ncbi:hypothetical protein AMQ83_09230 [Paenibacillus riograndensis]|nr:hypothetical protein AMQ83_09230 [Paenibacillus riograndensis]